MCTHVHVCTHIHTMSYIYKQIYITDLYNNIYIIHPIGTGSSNNCEAVQSETPATLAMQQKLSGLLTIRATGKILPGEPVYLDYGTKFWKNTVATAAGDNTIHVCVYRLHVHINTT